MAGTKKGVRKGKLMLRYEYLALKCRVSWLLYCQRRRKKDDAPGFVSLAPGDNVF